MHDFGGIAFPYTSDILFERLSDGDTTECRLGMTFVTWFIVKLDCYVTFCIDILIIVVDNDIIHMESKLISWNCVF